MPRVYPARSGFGDRGAHAVLRAPTAARTTAGLSRPKRSSALCTTSNMSTLPEGESTTHEPTSPRRPSTDAARPEGAQMYINAERIMLKTMQATAAWTIDRLVAIPTPSAPSRFFAL